MVADKKYTVISTFAGCGGSSLGYKWAGFKELLAIDFDKNAVDTFALNFDAPAWHRDIRTVTADEILKFCNIKAGELDIFDGSPPCQGFSTAGKQEVSDDRNDLFLEYVRLINGLQPKVFVMENVSGMIKGKFKGKFNEILGILKDTGYNVKCKLMNAKYYEVPQSRERLIFIGVRGDIGIAPVYPVPSKRIISVRDALVGRGNMPQFYHRGKFDKKKQSTDRPMQTITKTRSAKFIENGNERNITIEEAKLLQSFPLEFNMSGTDSQKWRRIGNSVPPKMMYHIAKTIKDEILDKVKK